MSSKSVVAWLLSICFAAMLSASTSALEVSQQPISFWEAVFFCSSKQQALVHDPTVIFGADLFAGSQYWTGVFVDYSQETEDYSNCNLILADGRPFRDVYSNLLGDIDVSKLCQGQYLYFQPGRIAPTFNVTGYFGSFYAVCQEVQCKKGYYFDASYGHCIRDWSIPAVDTVASDEPVTFEQALEFCANNNMSLLHDLSLLEVILPDFSSQASYWLGMIGVYADGVCYPVLPSLDSYSDFLDYTPSELEVFFNSLSPLCDDQKVAFSMPYGPESFFLSHQEDKHIAVCHRPECAAGTHFDPNFGWCDLDIIAESPSTSTSTPYSSWSSSPNFGWSSTSTRSPSSTSTDVPEWSSSTTGDFSTTSSSTADSTTTSSSNADVTTTSSSSTADITTTSSATTSSTASSTSLPPSTTGFQPGHDIAVQLQTPVQPGFDLYRPSTTFFKALSVRTGASLIDAMGVIAVSSAATRVTSLSSGEHHLGDLILSIYHTTQTASVSITRHVSIPSMSTQDIENGIKELLSSNKRSSLFGVVINEDTMEELYLQRLNVTVTLEQNSPNVPAVLGLLAVSYPCHLRSSNLCATYFVFATSLGIVDYCPPDQYHAQLADGRIQLEVPEPGFSAVYNNSLYYMDGPVQVGGRYPFPIGLHEFLVTLLPTPKATSLRVTCHFEYNVVEAAKKTVSRIGHVYVQNPEDPPNSLSIDYLLDAGLSSGATKPVAFKYYFTPSTDFTLMLFPPDQELFSIKYLGDGISTVISGKLTYCPEPLVRARPRSFPTIVTLYGVQNSNQSPQFQSGPDSGIDVHGCLTFDFTSQPLQGELVFAAMALTLKLSDYYDHDMDDRFVRRALSVGETLSTPQDPFAQTGPTGSSDTELVPTSTRSISSSSSTSISSSTSSSGTTSGSSSTSTETSTSTSSSMSTSSSTSTVSADQFPYTMYTKVEFVPSPSSALFVASRLTSGLAASRERRAIPQALSQDPGQLVTVADIFPPRFTSCPSETVELVAGPGQDAVAPTWPDPVAVDNSGEVLMEVEIANSDRSETAYVDAQVVMATSLPILESPYWFTYIARDRSDNEARCEFQVVVSFVESPTTATVQISDGNFTGKVDTDVLSNEFFVTSVYSDIFYETEGQVLSFNSTVQPDTDLNLLAIDFMPNGTEAFALNFRDEEVRCRLLIDITLYNRAVLNDVSNDPLYRDFVEDVRATVGLTDVQSLSADTTVELGAGLMESWEGTYMTATNETSPKLGIAKIVGYSRVLDESFSFDSLQIRLERPDGFVLSNSDGGAPGLADVEVHADVHFSYFYSDLTGAPEPAASTRFGFLGLRDDRAPSFGDSCPSSLRAAAGLGLATGVATWTEPVATDNQGVWQVVSNYQSPAVLSILPRGNAHVVEYVASDRAGLTARCVFNVTIEDDQPPTVGCPADLRVVVASDSSVARFDVNPFSANASDNSGIVASLTGNASTVYGLGRHVVGFEASDGWDNVGACNFALEVVDETKPIISGCPGNFEVTSTDGVGQAVDYDCITATDNDGLPPTMVGSRVCGGDVFDIGETPVTVKAVDSSGNEAVCAFTVTVREPTGSTVTSGSTLSDGALGGVIAGVLAVILVLLVLLVVFARRSRAKPHNFAAQSEKLREQFGPESDILEPTELRRSQIEVLDVLGQGNFGTVNRGRCNMRGISGVRFNADFDVAIKCLKAGAEGRAELLDEAAVMAQFDHDNVVRLIGVVTVGDPLLLVMEFCRNGALNSYLKKHDVDLDVKIKFALDCAKGMAYLASKKFVHRDLAARNVLVDRDLNCKIADFGLSRLMDNDEYYRSGGGALPVRWTAPEALEERKFTSASDVWAYGVLMYEIWTKAALPYTGWNNQTVWVKVTAGYRLPCPDKCPLDIHKLMMRCWERQPGDRITFGKIVESLSLMNPQGVTSKPSDKDSSERRPTLESNKYMSNTLRPRREAVPDDSGAQPVEDESGYVAEAPTWDPYLHPSSQATTGSDTGYGQPGVSLGSNGTSAVSQLQGGSDYLVPSRDGTGSKAADATRSPYLVPEVRVDVSRSDQQKGAITEQRESQGEFYSPFEAMPEHLRLQEQDDAASVNSDERPYLTPSYSSGDLSPSAQRKASGNQASQPILEDAASAEDPYVQPVVQSASADQPDASDANHYLQPALHIDFTPGETKTDRSPAGSSASFNVDDASPDKRSTGSRRLSSTSEEFDTLYKALMSKASQRDSRAPDDAPQYHLGDASGSRQPQARQAKSTSRDSVSSDERRRRHDFSHLQKNYV